MSNIGNLVVNVNLSTRKALYTPSRFNADKFGIDAGMPTEVGVFGLFSVREHDGEADAYFVVELPDGRCCYAGVEQIQFIKETEEETE
jgi:hypothetical protein